jgi:hypothetical protein
MQSYPLAVASNPFSLPESAQKWYLLSQHVPPLDNRRVKIKSVMKSLKVSPTNLDAMKSHLDAVWLDICRFDPTVASLECGKHRIKISVLGA